MSNPLEIVRSITIPDDAEVDLNLGMASFAISTPCGEVAARAWTMGTIMISGSPETIIDLGLAQEEWLPGYPGNNHTAQTVVFIGDRVELLHGWHRKGKRPPKESRIIIKKWGHEVPTVRVEAVASAEQSARVKELLMRPAPDSRKFTGYVCDGNVIRLRAQ